MTISPTTKEQQLQQLAIVTDIIKQSLSWEYQVGSEWYPSSRAIHPFTALYDGHEIRIKPTPTLIPLEASDISPGSVVRLTECEYRLHWCTIYAVGADAAYVGVDDKVAIINYQRLKDEWQINRSIPLLGKWSPTAWEPCSKPSQSGG